MHVDRPVSAIRFARGCPAAGADGGGLLSATAWTGMFCDGRDPRNGRVVYVMGVTSAAWRCAFISPSYVRRQTSVRGREGA